MVTANRHPCNACGDVWSNEDLQKLRWAGISFCWDENNKSLICPECYDEMKAAFISSPENFMEWKTAYGFGKRR